MIARLIQTQGYALEAEIEYKKHPLTVMDAFSPPGQACRPGLIFEARFSCLEIEALSWEEFFRGNAKRRKDLQVLNGWDYTGRGEVVKVNPMVIDFGLFRLQGGYPTHDPRCIGDYVAGTVRCLSLHGLPERPPLQRTSFLGFLRKIFR